MSATSHSALLVAAAPSVHGRTELVRELAASADIVIGVDGGAGLCLSAGVRPHVVVGDMDSLAPHDGRTLRESGTTFVVASTDKDVTDLDIAFDYCSRHGVSRVVATACTGGRLDHTLAATGTLATWARLQPHVVEPDMQAWVLASGFREELLLSRAEMTFSVLAMGSEAQVSVVGARWPLREATLTPLSSLGVSNVVAAGGAVVRVHSGTVMVVTNASV